MTVPADRESTSRVFTPGRIVALVLVAAAGGNLALLVLDIAWDWLARDRFAATNVKEALEARPSTG